MQRQITVRVPDSLLDELDQRAALERRKRSDVIRLAIERFLAEPPSDERRPIDRVQDLIGSHESGVPDLGQRHREHLLRRLCRAR
jgi:metal-responsive CopG/Arc/MetJ family transcriptional regulator